MRVKVSLTIKENFNLSSRIAEVCGTDKEGVWIRVGTKQHSHACATRHHNGNIKDAKRYFDKDFKGFGVKDDWQITYLNKSFIKLCQACYEN